MDLSELTALCARYYSENGPDIAELPGLSLFCREAPSAVEAVVYEPVMSLILQGRKVTAIGDQLVELAAGDALLVSHHLPVVSRITEASTARPYLAVILSLDLELVRGLQGELAGAPETGARPRALAKATADPDWLAPLVRYFGFLDSPLDARVLGPGTLREIHYRLLLSPIGQMLRDLLVADSHASRIARAIGQVRADFRATLSVAELARTAGMSASSFHVHFKSVTGTTPLRYQKDLRLIEARSLLAAANRSVSEAAFAVGYESPTHFSRDYARKFGLPPSRHIGAAVAGG